MASAAGGGAGVAGRQTGEVSVFHTHTHPMPPPFGSRLSLLSLPDSLTVDLWQVELETRSLTIDRKRLYFNLRENSRGRFIKVPVPTHT